MTNHPEELLKYKNYVRDEQGVWANNKTGEVVGHEEECQETYEAISSLMEVFSEITIDS